MPAVRRASRALCRRADAGDEISPEICTFGNAAGCGSLCINDVILMRVSSKALRMCARFVGYSGWLCVLRDVHMVEIFASYRTNGMQCYPPNLAATYDRTYPQFSSDVSGHNNRTHTTTKTVAVGLHFQ